MAHRTRTVHRLVGTVVAATIAMTTLAGLTASGPAHAAAPMAKCIPGSGNPLNPCPS